MRTDRTGILILLGKLAPKLLPIVWKAHDAIVAAIKSLFGIKAAGIVGSVGLYTYLLNWKMAVALVVFIIIHEYGHVWAMRHCGIKVTGVYIIPGFGGVALADDKTFGSARNEAYIAIMGPVVSFVLFVVPAALYFLYSKDPQWAAIAAVMAFVNVINLLPINPLDGGRILKALAYSHRHAASLAATVGVSLVTSILGAVSGFGLLIYMAIAGLFEVTEQFGIRAKIKLFLLSLARVGGAVFIGFLAKWLMAWDGTWVWKSWISFLAVAVVVLISGDALSSTKAAQRSVFMYPFQILLELVGGFVQMAKLRMSDVQPIEGYAVMSTWWKATHAAIYFFVAFVHIYVIFRLVTVPGVELVKELLE